MHMRLHNMQFILALTSVCGAVKYLKLINANYHRMDFREFVFDIVSKKAISIV